TPNDPSVNIEIFGGVTGRFMIAVKLNRGLKTSNYGQLYAYLKQHEAHANENKMMLEKYTQHAIDPLAFVSNVSLQQQNRVQGNNARGAVAAGNRGVQNKVGNAKPGQPKPIKCYNCNGIGYIARQCTHPKRPQNSEYFKDKMLLMQDYENIVVLDEEQLLFIAGGQDRTFDDDVDESPVQDLAFNVDHVFQADQCDAFDSDVDEAPTTQTMFMEKLSLVDLIYDKASSSYDSDILSEVQDHDNYIDSVGEYHEVHEMQNDVQQNYVLDSDAEYTSDSNTIPYEQYMKDNAVQVVQSNVSSVPNNPLMMIIIDMHEQAALIVIHAVNTVSRFSELHDAYTVEQAHVVELEAEISKLKHKIQKDDHSKMIKRFSNLKKKVKQHYKIILAKTIEKTSSLLTENEKLKAHLKRKTECATMNTVKLKVLVLGMYAIDVESIPPRNRNNREVHLVRFRNDHFDAIMGYRDYMIGDNVISKMAPVHRSTGLKPILMKPGQISLGLVPDPVPAAPYVPPTNKDMEILLQPMFDEYFKHPSVERPVPPAVQVPVVLAGTPFFTTIDQDAPSTSHSLSSSELQAPILHQGVTVGPTFKDNPFAQDDDKPFVNVFAPEPSFEASSS
nr:hypothetical protein [Tanacetum cinerariifolium]